MVTAVFRYHGGGNLHFSGPCSVYRDENIHFKGPWRSWALKWCGWCPKTKFDALLTTPASSLTSIELMLSLQRFNALRFFFCFWWSLSLVSSVVGLKTKQSPESSPGRASTFVQSWLGMSIGGHEWVRSSPYSASFCLDLIYRSPRTLAGGDYLVSLNCGWSQSRFKTLRVFFVNRQST